MVMAEAADQIKVKVVGTKPVKQDRAPAGLASLEVTLQAGTVDELQTLDAKNLAYAQRAKHGMADAGIEAIGGAIAVDKRTGKPIATADMTRISNERPNDIVYQRTFRLLQTL
jgi:hypothetical protein